MSPHERTKHAARMRIQNAKNLLRRNRIAGRPQLEAYISRTRQDFDLIGHEETRNLCPAVILDMVAQQRFEF